MVLDQEHVYILKIFKKKLFITSKILNSKINLETKLTFQNKTEFVNKIKNLINSLWTFLFTNNIYNYLL